MNFLNNITIKYKLFLGFLLLLVFVIIIIFTSYSGLYSLRRTQRTLTQIEFPLTIELLKLRTTLNRERMTLTRIIMLSSKKEGSSLNEELADYDHEVNSIVDTIKKLGKYNSEIMIGIGEFTVQRKNYI